MGAKVSADRKTKLDPAFARELRRAWRRQEDAEEAFRAKVLEGSSAGQGMSAMAREIDPSGEIVSRQLVWQWVQAWRDGEK